MLAITGTTAAIWTAIGTLALAIATSVSLAFGWRSLRQSQREVEEAHRPVVIPVVFARPSVIAGSRSQSRRAVPERPYAVEDGVLAVPIKNIGSGPALSVVASIKRLNDDGTVREGGVIEPQTPGKIPGLGNEVVVPIEIRAHGWEARWDFELTLSYQDVAGKRWARRGRYMAAQEIYEDVAIAAISAAYQR
jgi:hypothetical protein